LNKVKLIINPHANLGRARQAAEEIRMLAEELGPVDWEWTERPTQAIEMAFQAAQAGYELVIAGGGDGTAHEVLNGLMRVPEQDRPIFSVLPLGSGNDFSYGIGINHQPSEALRQIFHGQPSCIDIARFSDDTGHSEYWGNAVGIGFDTVVTLRSRRFTMFRGFAIYLLAVIQTIILDNDSPAIQVETDQESWSQKTILLVICNGGREGGGFKISPQAKVDDGMLNYASIRQVSRPMMFRLLPEVMNGTHGRFEQVRMGECHRLNLQSDRPLYVHIDGEIYSGFGSNLRRLSVEILPGALQVMR
jgi:YegS/Rv2252/BmrU family lipid kinase